MGGARTVSQEAILITAIADYLDALAEKQPTRETKRALRVAAANVRAGLFVSKGAERANNPLGVIQ